MAEDMVDSGSCRPTSEKAWKYWEAPPSDHQGRWPEEVRDVCQRISSGRAHALSYRSLPCMNERREDERRLLRRCDGGEGIQLELEVFCP